MMMFTVSQAFNGAMDFEIFVQEKFDGIDRWMKRMENANKPFFIPPKLCQNMRKNIEEAFMHDNNTLIEEKQYAFYSIL
jgi:hypothetical protein